MKESCLICDIELGKYETDVCSNCFLFFSAKYGGKFKKELTRFKESKTFLDKWRAHKDTTEKEVEE